MAYFFKRQFDEAASKLRAVLSRPSRLSPAIPLSRRVLCPYGPARRSPRGSSPGCAPSPPGRAERAALSATPSTANCCCPGCAWRWARRDEPETAAASSTCRSKIGGGRLKNTTPNQFTVFARRGGARAHDGIHRPAVARQTVDRGAAVSEHERRPGAGIFRRRHGRGDHHGVVADPLALRHRPQFELHLQRRKPSM